MGGSTKTLTDTQHTETSPWAPAVPALNNILGDAQNLYQSGSGTGIYSGGRVAGLNSDSISGLQGIRDQAAADNSAGIALTGLQNIVNGNGGVSYNGPTLDSNGLSAGTVGALGNLAGVQGADLSGLNNFIGSTYGDQSKINQTASSFMNGSRDITTQPIYQGLLGYNAGPAASETNLSDVASGKYLDPTTNPYLQAAVAASNQNVGNAQKEAFAASGRYGSGNFAAATAKAINDTDTTLYANQYNQERSNQLSANSMLDAARTNRISAGNTLANGITNVQSTNNQQILAGAGLQQNQNAQQLSALGTQLGGQEFNSNLDYNKAATALGAYQTGTSQAMTNGMNAANVALNSQGQAIQAAGMIPGVDASRYAPAAQLLQAGNIGQTQDQNAINAQMQQYAEQNGMPWQALDNYAGLVGGIGGMGGTSNGTSTRQVQVPGLGQTLLGGALGIGGMVANLGKAGLF